MAIHTEQKMKFSTKDFFSKCDQIRRKLRIWSHLLKKSLMKNFIFCAMSTVSAAKETNKKIAKLSLRITLLLCMFLTPYIVATNLVRGIIPSQLSYNKRSLLELVYCLTLIFINANSLANALLFLLTNVKAKRFFPELTK